MNDFGRIVATAAPHRSTRRVGYRSMPKQDPPIDGVISESVASLETANSVVIEAAPGAGKTTRVQVAIDRPDVTQARMIVALHFSGFKFTSVLLPKPAT